MKKIKAKRGFCYENAFRFIMDNPDWILVHGIVIGSGPTNLGKEMGHAWAENETDCYDPYTDIIILPELFYHFGQVKYVVKYTFKEALSLANKHKTYGAWDSKINKTLHRK